MIQSERVQALRPGAPVAGRHWVLYWMQQSQRGRCNHALEHAVEVANGLGLPVLVAFGVAPSFPDATPAHYAFMLAGLRETAADLQARGIGVVILRGDPPEAVLPLTGGAALAVADRGYLQIQRQWRVRFAAGAACPVVQVESDVTVPVEVASAREEFAAATLRPKLRRHWERYLVPLREREVRRPWSPVADVQVQRLIGAERASLEVPVAGGRPGSRVAGRQAARQRLDGFLRESLGRYHQERSHPGVDLGSGLSAHLHFGQVSALEIALAVRAAEAPQEARDAFLEELLVRRELAVNFVYYNPSYERYAGTPAWCRASLAAHAADVRPYLYAQRDLADAATHDPYWNAAQRELLTTGQMHGYMRMYWGKKILEWTRDPETAFGIALELNNRLELDGRDPNGFAGVAWCFGKHDRPWIERPIFGKVRYMNAKGLCRKFDMSAYLARVDAGVSHRQDG